MAEEPEHGYDKGHGFDKDYWEQHWHRGRDGGAGSMGTNPPNPYLARELHGLRPGTALDAGCGAGAEAVWLATAGWRVTAADISSEALARAAERAALSRVGDRIQWVEADLRAWEPESPFDLVTTHYAHPAMPQLEFYDRVAAWVAPGGTLLVVGHRRRGGSGDHDHDHDHHHDHGAPPDEASVTAASITARLDGATWDVLTAEEPQRTVGRPGGREVTLDDVVVRATRRR